jgi:hypothetical protein
MVGRGVRHATGGRGGRRFQVLAIVLTYWAVGLAYVPVVVSGVRQAQQRESSQPTATAAAPAVPATDAPPTIPMFLILTAAFPFALPVLIVASSLPGSLISAAIIAFGMQQAWRMTAAPQIVITGPYRISAAGSSPVLSGADG